MGGVTLHARVRWAGVVLFVLALPAAVGIVLNVIGGAPLSQLLLAILGLGTSLGTFGTNNDTALVAMQRDARLGMLDPRFADELADESHRRPADLKNLHTSPKAALAFPLIASAAVAYAWFRTGWVG